jgi:hypothetical protein
LLRFGKLCAFGGDGVAGVALITFDSTVVEVNHAATAMGDAGIVGDQHDGLSGGDKFIEQLQNLLAGFAVERTGGFIGEEKERFVDQGAGDADALLLAAGKLHGTMIESIFQSDAVGEFDGALTPLAGRDSEVEHRHFQIFDNRELLNEIEILKNKTDASTADFAEAVIVEKTGVGIAKYVRPAGGLIETTEDVHQRAFARAAGAHDGGEFAALKVQGDLAEGGHLHICSGLAVDLA